MPPQVSAFLTKWFLVQDYYRFFFVYQIYMYKINPLLWPRPTNGSHQLYRHEYTLPKEASTQVQSFWLNAFQEELKTKKHTGIGCHLSTIAFKGPVRESYICISSFNLEHKIFNQDPDCFPRSAIIHPSNSNDLKKYMFTIWSYLSK